MVPRTRMSIDSFKGRALAFKRGIFHLVQRLRAMYSTVYIHRTITL